MVHEDSWKLSQKWEKGKAKSISTHVFEFSFVSTQFILPFDLILVLVSSFRDEHDI